MSSPISTHPTIVREDDDGTVVTASATEGQLLGRPVAELTGARLEQLVRAADAADVVAARARATDRGTAVSCVATVETPQAGPTAPAATRWELVFHPGLLEGGGCIVLLRDLDRALRTAREAALLRRVTETSNAGTDPTETLLRAVRDVRHTMGWAAGHLLRATEGRLVPVPSSWDHEDGLAALPGLLHAAPAPELGGAVGVAAATGRPAGDAEADATPRLELLRELDLHGAVAVPVLVDDRVDSVLEFFAATPQVLDDDQRALLRNVGRQLGSVAARRQVLDQLESQRDELERSNAELERFAYVASHDLQEPLRKIVGFAELLVQHRPPADEDEEAFLGYIVDGAYRMQRLIKDLLAFSRAGRRELASDPVDLGVLLDQVRADLGLAIEESGATVTAAGALPTVRGDAGQLRAVLQNLVENALKYRAEAPPVITLDATSADGETELTVTDNGMGIEPQFREQVFEVFRRLHPAHEHGGTGLGLALVERIVLRHGGRVWIESGPDGVGTSFHLTLPTHEEPT